MLRESTTFVAGKAPFQTAIHRVPEAENTRTLAARNCSFCPNSAPLSIELVFVSTVQLFRFLPGVGKPPTRKRVQTDYSLPPTPHTLQSIQREPENENRGKVLCCNRTIQKPIPRSNYDCQPSECTRT